MTAPLTLYDSYTRQVRPFEPITPGEAKVYSCGPTVYHYAHLGNLRAYVFTDTLARVLRWKGYDLTHVINITDVGHLTSDADAGEDKMERAASTTGKSIWDVAAFYTEAFKADLKALNVGEPSRWSVATDHVEDMIAFTKSIETHAYPLESGLYFDTSTVPDYGRLAGHAPEEDGIGRIAHIAGKRHPADFALWRASPPGEKRQMEWDSPWGRGAPGWHLECSVMSLKYLGEQFDIHTGGIDHREIHHPNEIAQNQARTGGRIGNGTGANFWMHNNFLVDRTGKMSKSAGDALLLRSVIDRGIHPLAYRMMCLQAHYRSEMEFSWEGLTSALVRLKRLFIQVERLGLKEAADAHVQNMSDDYEELKEHMDSAASRDLATPDILTVVEAALAKTIALSATERREIIAGADQLLGLGLLTTDRTALRLRPKGLTIAEGDIAARIAERAEAKRARDFATADAIRADLAEHGVELMDGDPLGWEWRVKLV